MNLSSLPNMEYPSNEETVIVVADNDTPARKSRNRSDDGEEDQITPKRHRSQHSKFIAEFSEGKCRHCEYKPKDLRACNAKRHLERAHRNIYDRLNLLITPTAEITDAKRNLVLFAATTSFPLTFLENDYFKKLVSEIKGLKTVPCRRSMLKLMQDELEVLRANVTKILSSAEAISLSSDIATTKGMRFSYLGVIAHVRYDSKYISLALDIVEMLDQHRGTYIRNLLDKVVRDYNINTSKIIRVTTDGATNMKAALINPFILPTDENDDEETAEIVNSSELNAIIQMYENPNDENPNDPKYPTIEINAELQLKCAAHRLQLVLKDVFEKNDIATDIKKIVFSILGKYSKSHDATKALYLATKKKLQFPANTRWSSLQITYERLLEIFESVNIISKARGWPEITDNQIKLIRDICNIVTPFRGFTDKLQREGCPTISLLFPGIMRLLKNLREESNNLPEISAALIKSLEKRFSDVINSGKEGADPTFLVASYLDPAMYCVSNNEYDVLAEAAIRKMCVRYVDGINHSINSEMTSVSTEIFGFAVECSQSEKLSVDAEIATFFADRKRPYFRNKSACEYWEYNKTIYPVLHNLAFEVLCIPATSAGVERMFSQMTLNTTGHKGSTGPETTRIKVLLNYNKAFVK